jgi:septal ring-binding cell division protein DamX
MIQNFRNKKDAINYAKRYGLYSNYVVFAFENKYKLIYGAYDSYKEAVSNIQNLKSHVRKTNPYVRKITGYQKLYRKYKNVPKAKTKDNTYYPNNYFKNEFLNSRSKKYTVTLTTLPSFKEAKWFRYKYKINKNTIVYNFDRRVKVIYGIFNSAKEANKAIENFDNEIKRLKPFVNRLSTHQKLFRKYNKNIED